MRTSVACEVVALTMRLPTASDDDRLDVRPSRSRLDRGIVTVLAETKNHDGVVVRALKATLVVLRR